MAEDHHQKTTTFANSTSTFTVTIMEIVDGGKDAAADPTIEDEEQVNDGEERLEDLAIYRLDYEDDEQQGESHECLGYDAAAATASAEFRATTRTLQQPRAVGGEILQPGDHCYMWCTLYQHHAIVLETYPAAVAVAAAAAAATKTADIAHDAAADVEQRSRIPENTPEQQQQQQHKCNHNTCCNDIDEIEEQEESLQPAAGLGSSVGGSVGAGGSILIAEFTNLALAEDLAAGLAVTAAPTSASSSSSSSSSSIFASASTAAGATSGGGVPGGFRIVRETDPHLKWHKVKYQAHPVLECLTWRPGTCSAATRLPTLDILMRVHFLYEWGHVLIPDYHLVFSNCETVAVWCVTGQWMTLQGDGALRVSTLGTAAAAAVTTMAMAPLGLALAATSGGLALWRSMLWQKQCHDTAAMLNRQYEWYSLGRTPSKFSFQPTA